MCRVISWVAGAGAGSLMTETKLFVIGADMGTRLREGACVPGYGGSTVPSGRREEVQGRGLRATAESAHPSSPIPPRALVFRTGTVSGDVVIQVVDPRARKVVGVIPDDQSSATSQRGSRGDVFVDLYIRDRQRFGRERSVHT